VIYEIIKLCNKTGKDCSNISAPQFLRRLEEIRLEVKLNAIKAMVKCEQLRETENSFSLNSLIVKASGSISPASGKDLENFTRNDELELLSSGTVLRCLSVSLSLSLSPSLSLPSYFGHRILTEHVRDNVNQVESIPSLLPLLKLRIGREKRDRRRKFRLAPTNETLRDQ
jgi:hypothetical protein